MLDPAQVLVLTSHPVGGVTAFGLATPLPVYCISLRAFDEVVPAAKRVAGASTVVPSGWSN